MSAAQYNANIDDKSSLAKHLKKIRSTIDSIVLLEFSTNFKNSITLSTFFETFSKEISFVYEVFCFYS